MEGDRREPHAGGKKPASPLSPLSRGGLPWPLKVQPLCPQTLGSTLHRRGHPPTNWDPCFTFRKPPRSPHLVRSVGEPARLLPSEGL